MKKLTTCAWPVFLKRRKNKDVIPGEEDFVSYVRFIPNIYLPLFGITCELE